MANIIQQLIDYVINKIPIDYTHMHFNGLVSNNIQHPLPSFIGHPQLCKTFTLPSIMFGFTYLLRQFLHCVNYLFTPSSVDQTILIITTAHNNIIKKKTKVN